MNTSRLLNIFEYLILNIYFLDIKLPKIKKSIISIFKRLHICLLGSGPTGNEEIKAHPFFKGIDWNNLKIQPSPT